MTSPRRNHRPAPPRHVAAVALALFAMIAAGCSSKQDPLEIGFKRVSLDLVFKDETKAPPLEPQKVVQVIEFFDQDFPSLSESFEEEPEEAAPRRRRPLPPPRADIEPPCIPAGEGVVSEIPVFATTPDPPKVGSYTRHNSGTIKIEVQAPLPSGTLPYPPRTTWDITDVTVDRGTIATNPDDEKTLGALPQSPATPELVRFTVTRHLSRSSKTIDTYQYYLERGDADRDSTNMDGDGIYLVRRETLSSTFGNSVFTPTPPVMIAPIDDESEVSEVQTSAGIDRASNASMSVRSKVVGRDYIDACGEVFDTYRVEWEEQFLDLSGTTPAVSGNVESGKPNIWNIAYNRNVHIAREEMHTTSRTLTATTPPIPVVVKYDYVSTLASPEPKPIKPPTPPGAPTGDGATDDEEDE